MGDSKDNLLWISWHDSAWIPILNPANVMDYFQSNTNPFYDRTCNNEIVKMQRLNMDHLSNLTGLEYMLLHVQEPILYVIRKQHRHSPTVVTPLADFYIIAGVVYQAPDLGYWWEFKESEAKQAEEESRKSNKKKSTKEKAKEEPGSAFQRHRIGILLQDLTTQFPMKNLPLLANPAVMGPTVPSGPATENQDGGAAKVEVKVEVKTEALAAKPPPEKKARLA
uniref:Mediator of RNA polymerase II transcription subunit 6 n=1 Tax=Alona affinis TaxID=381656 RepID=A0A9N6ZF05_9CRUS|nr:EOG090X0E0D [Alona affinis]